MLRPLLAALSLAVAMPAMAQNGPPQPAAGHRNGYANPSAVIAAEMALSRLSQEQGQWSALRDTAAPGAVLFAPEMVLALPWLKDRRNPPAAPRWQVHEVWSSCDGSLMVAEGAWQGSQARGWFTALWERQDKGDYKWVLRDGGESVQPLAEPDMIAAHVADCPPRPKRTGAEIRRGSGRRMKSPPVPFDPARREGSSRDGSLTWGVTADTAGARELVVRMRQDGEMKELQGAGGG